MEEKIFFEAKAYFRRVLEFSRRYKIMNPGTHVCIHSSLTLSELMRTQYGKLIYMLQDARSDEVGATHFFSANSALTAEKHA